MPDVQGEDDVSSVTDRIQRGGGYVVRYDDGSFWPCSVAGVLGSAFPLRPGQCEKLIADGVLSVHAEYGSAVIYRLKEDT